MQPGSMYVAKTRGIFAHTYISITSSGTMETQPGGDDMYRRILAMLASLGLAESDLPPEYMLVRSDNVRLT